ncbi:MAG: nitrate reductase NapE component [Alphaproteobacteria bacterium]|jgi:nitrate reductase NapE component
MSAAVLLILTIVLAVIVLGFFGIILWKMLNNDITLNQLISEPDGKASLSRFQLLLFTFVVAGLFLILSLQKGAFEPIPDSVLVLIGISGGGFVVSKAVGKSMNGDVPPK